MGQFRQAVEPDDVCITIIRDGRRVPVDRYVPRSFIIGDIIATFATKAKCCYIHSSITQDALFMQRPFLNRTLYDLPYASCSYITLEIESCFQAHECQLNHLHMCVT